MCDRVHDALHIICTSTNTPNCVASGDSTDSRLCHAAGRLRVGAMCAMRSSVCAHCDWLCYCSFTGALLVRQSLGCTRRQCVVCMACWLASAAVDPCGHWILIRRPAHLERCQVRLTALRLAVRCCLQQDSGPAVAQAHGCNRHLTIMHAWAICSISQAAKGSAAHHSPLQRSHRSVATDRSGGATLLPNPSTSSV